MTIIAKYRGKCSKCGCEIQPGDKIEWESGKSAYHTKCPTQKKVEEKSANTNAVDTINIRRGSGYGGMPFVVGKFVWNKNRDGSVQGVIVVSVSQKYFRDDGMSFGVGDDRGYAYYADCRLANQEEIQKSIDSMHGVALEFNRTRKIADLFKKIQKEGEYPQGQFTLTAEEFFETGHDQRIYGGGAWMVIQDGFVWAVQNRGADGDDWGHNNVVTGGAGAVGCRVPATDDLLAYIAALRG